MPDFYLSGESHAIDFSQTFDVAIIGSGPAGLTAAIYSGRYGFKTILIEKNIICGGQLAVIDNIENYPGFKTPVSGIKLANAMETQALKMGVNILKNEARSVNFSDRIKEITTSKGNIKTRSVIICTGAQPKTLNVPGEKEYINKGVSYCAACDGHLYAGKTIAVIGGGNAAVEETITLTKHAEKIFLIHRRDNLRADKLIQDKVKSNTGIELILNTIVKKINFGGTDKKNILIDTLGNEKQLYVDGIFIFVGIIPATKLFINTLSLKDGFIVTDQEMKTNIEGIFAAGDVRHKHLRQITTATGDGTLAAFSAKTFLERNFS